MIEITEQDKKDLLKDILAERKKILILKDEIRDLQNRFDSLYMQICSDKEIKIAI